MLKQSFIFNNLLLALGLFLFTACGNTADSGNAEVATETSTEVAAPDTPDESGPEYTSAYICPMYCAGSGSATAGTCPVCGMDYVANDKHPSHDHSGHDHSGHDHSGHDHSGHNH